MSPSWCCGPKSGGEPAIGPTIRLRGQRLHFTFCGAVLILSLVIIKPVRAIAEIATKQASVFSSAGFSEKLYYNRRERLGGYRGQLRSRGRPVSVSNEVIIEAKGRPTQEAVEALAKRHKLNRIESQHFQLSDSTLFRWSIPDRRSVQEVIRELAT